MRAHPSQDVHAVGHLVWQIFSAPRLVSQNLWLNPVSGVVMLISVIGVVFCLGKSTHSSDELSGRV